MPCFPVERFFDVNVLKIDMKGMDKMKYILIKFICSISPFYEYNDLKSMTIEELSVVIDKISR